MNVDYLSYLFMTTTAILIYLFIPFFNLYKWKASAFSDADFLLHIAA